MIADNPRPAPYELRGGRSLMLDMMMTSEPVRPASASERAAVLQRAAALKRATAALADREAARALQRDATAFVAARRSRRR